MDNHEIASKLRDWHLAGGLSGMLDQDELDLLWAAQAVLAAAGTLDDLPDDAECRAIRGKAAAGTGPTREQIAYLIHSDGHYADGEHCLCRPEPGEYAAADAVLALVRAPSEAKP